MRRSNAVIWPSALLLLAACRGDGNPPANFCTAIGGGAASASSSCAGCTVSNAAATVDADLDTFSIIDWPANATGSVIGSAQSGVALLGTGRAGVLIRRPALGAGDALEITIRTLQGTTVVNEGVAYSSVTHACPNCSVSGDFTFVGIPATDTYNAIELAFTKNGNQTPALDVHEFCTKGS